MIPVESNRDSYPGRGAQPPPSAEEVALAARRQADAWRESSRGSRALAERHTKLAKELDGLFSRMRNLIREGGRPPAGLAALLQDAALVNVAILETKDAARSNRDLPQVSGPEGAVLPRAFPLASGYLEAVAYQFHPGTLGDYVNAFGQTRPATMGELWALRPMAQIAVLERLAESARSPLPEEIELLLACLREIALADWKEIFDGLSRTEAILREDPADAYRRMDFDSRDEYRAEVAKIARGSKKSEEEVARLAVELAQEARRDPREDPRAAERRQHVGYYLIAEGVRLLARRTGFRPSIREYIGRGVLAHPTLFYMTAIFVTMATVIGMFILLLNGTAPLLAAIVVLLLPAADSAIGLVNQIATLFLRPRRLPKLDFSDGIPADCATMVAVPSLLLSDEQVRELVDAIEIRYLANAKRNLYFALLTDSPDSNEQFDEKDDLVERCSRLIVQLNRRHPMENGQGPFYLFHRHRVYSATEGRWMGWERKRGKLMDLNNLLRGEFDSFPVKAGDLSILPSIRYVITLDADTTLPKDSAQRLTGALAHPLNRAVVDPETRTVVEGYGILQPRIGVSIDSAVRSRMATILSGQTGFDIYTRAISDIYQDLFGEGSFTGKGIYEVDVFQEVLRHRFPNNTLLSHDLIEGAYTRAGLVSDIELVDDYPSHFTAYSKRKHRWVRGDWQTLLWLLPAAPDYHGHWTRNPLSILSRWKILDNLRRSLTEISYLVLLIAAWFFMPGSAYFWTVTALILLLLPAFLRFLLALPRIFSSANPKGQWEQSVDDLFESELNVFFFAAFLPHQVFLLADAIGTTLIRLLVTRRRLLEWETAEQAELGLSRRSAVEKYLDWAPWLALLMTTALLLVRPHAMPAAIPFLLLWIVSPFLSRWLNRPVYSDNDDLTPNDRLFLRNSALRTWRFFREFSTPENNWLIPDSVQDEPALVTQTSSPTNLGLLLNVRLAAFELGYLTVEEFADLTAKTLVTIKRMTRNHGHLMNWYANDTLEPLPPLFVSTVDSGNFAVSLWTLKQGAVAAARRELAGNSIWQGVVDHLNLLHGISSHMARWPEMAAGLARLAESIEKAPNRPIDKIWALLDLEGLASQLPPATEREDGEELRWWLNETGQRLDSVRRFVTRYIPWALPEFRLLLTLPELRLRKMTAAATLERLPAIVAELDQGLAAVSKEEVNGSEIAEAANALRRLLPDCVRAAETEGARLREVASDADRMVREMDFRFLYNRTRKLLSVGYDAEQDLLHRSCYDLLASEARMAVFIAIAKGDAPLEAWFHLGRGHILYNGERVLQSWTGTMFEYLMPLLWMRCPPNTVLGGSARAAVRSQREFARSRFTPWGVSEAAYAVCDLEGRYQYQAFGIPEVAARQMEFGRLVISPYSSLLALAVDPVAAISNLRQMSKMRWSGAYGFYESAEFATPGDGEPRRHEVVRSWMAHHQGMGLLSLANLLAGNAISAYFHAEPMVAAVEPILAERAPAAIPVRPPDNVSIEPAMNSPLSPDALSLGT